MAMMLNSPCIRDARNPSDPVGVVLDLVPRPIDTIRPRATLDPDRKFFSPTYGLLCRISPHLVFLEVTYLPFVTRYQHIRRNFSNKKRNLMRHVQETAIFSEWPYFSQRPRVVASQLTSKTTEHRSRLIFSLNFNFLSSNY